MQRSGLNRFRPLRTLFTMPCETPMISPAFSCPTSFTSFFRVFMETQGNTAGIALSIPPEMAGRSAAAQHQRMASKDRKKPLSPEQVAACRRLKKLWDARKLELGLTQDKAAESLG